jgi:hypothetical protein
VPTVLGAAAVAFAAVWQLLCVEEPPAAAPVFKMKLVSGPSAAALPLDAKADPPAPPAKSEKDAKLAQKLGQLQPFTAVFPQDCMGQLAPFGPT